MLHLMKARIKWNQIVINGIIFLDRFNSKTIAVCQFDT